MNPTPLSAPPGLQALISHCQSIYPDQPNPLQVTTVLKYWLGGQDPLDYISMYRNPGDAARNIPPHFHYVSFGLSDLHGDNRVHLPTTDTPTVDNAGGSTDADRSNRPSGLGFEMSFRLAHQPVSGSPSEKELPIPTWPATMLQSLARYVFTTGNRLCAGDNVPWGRRLDGMPTVHWNMGIRNLLVAPDAQMSRIQTPFGWVDFCQIVGVTDLELEQAMRWNGGGVCNLLRKSTITGGEWLITDMQRTQSVFELFPDTLVQLEHDLETEGSDLAGVNGEFRVRELSDGDFAVDSELSAAIEQKCRLAENVIKTEVKSDNELDDKTATEEQPVPSADEKQIVQLNGVQLTLAPVAAKFLLIAVKDRIRHGRHFTFKCGNRALTFVSESVSGAKVTPDKPYGVMGYWTQVLIDDKLVLEMIKVFRELSSAKPDSLELPKQYSWPDRKLRIVIDAL